MKVATKISKALIETPPNAYATNAILQTLNDLIRAVSSLDLTVREHIADTKHVRKGKK